MIKIYEQETARIVTLFTELESVMAQGQKYKGPRENWPY